MAELEEFHCSKEQRNIQDKGIFLLHWLRKPILDWKTRNSKRNWDLSPRLVSSCPTLWVNSGETGGWVVVVEYMETQVNLKTSEKLKYESHFTSESLEGCLLSLYWVGSCCRQKCYNGVFKQRRSISVRI